MSPNGNLVLYAGARVLWSTQTHGNPGARAVQQVQGNLVVYSKSNVALWTNRMWDYPGATLHLQPDGNLVAYHYNRAIWATHTHQSQPPLPPVDDGGMPDDLPAPEPDGGRVTIEPSGVGETTASCASAADFFSTAVLLRKLLVWTREQAEQFVRWLERQYVRANAQRMHRAIARLAASYPAFNQARSSAASCAQAAAFISPGDIADFAKKAFRSAKRVAPRVLRRVPEVALVECALSSGLTVVQGALNKDKLKRVATDTVFACIGVAAGGAAARRTR